MIWRTQYRAIMLGILIIMILTTPYTGDPDIVIVGFGIQLLLHAVLTVLHFIFVVFGKQLFYSVRINKNGKVYD